MSDSTNSGPEAVQPTLRDQPFVVDIIDRATVFEGRVWDVVHETFTYNDHSIVRDFVDHTGAVAVLAMDADHRILAIQQYRHPIRTRDWEIPAGLLDEPGESPLAAAKRELAEEADLVADRWDLLVDITTSPGGSNEFLRIYLARDLHPTPTPYPRTEEEADIVLRWISLDDAVAAVLDGSVRNVGLVNGVLSAAASRAVGWKSLRPGE
jgi:8-oxo-dGDP phosphatase